MADSFTQLLSCPNEKTTKSPIEFDKQCHDYIEKTLKKISQSQWTRPADKDKQTLLDLLDPCVSTLPYLFALVEYAKLANKDKKKLEDVFSHAQIFLTSFSVAQARHAGDYWRSIWEWTAEVARNNGVTDLSFLLAALLRLDPTAGTFTSMHLQFLRLCMDLGLPSQALPLLGKTIYAFPQSLLKGVSEETLSADHELSNAFITVKSGFSAKVTPDMVLEYYLLGAHVYIGLRNYGRARLFLETVILHPSSHHAVSALQIEAYKKFVLLGLLSEGRRYPLPKTIEPSIMKNIRALAKNYEALADDFEKRNWRKLIAETDFGMNEWQLDGNMRLVREVGGALLRYRVMDLQKTYASLPISRVASHLDMPSDITANTLSDLIRTGQLQASLTPGGSGAGDAVLRFNATGATPSPISPRDDELQAQTIRIENLVTYIRDADRRLQLTKEYVDFAKKQKRMGPEADLADQMDLTYDAPPVVPMMDEEEDLMGA